jgi:hypothetical protein
VTYLPPQTAPLELRQVESSRSVQEIPMVLRAVANLVTLLREQCNTECGAGTPPVDSSDHSLFYLEESDRRECKKYNSLRIDFRKH